MRYGILGPPFQGPFVILPSKRMSLFIYLFINWGWGGRGDGGIYWEGSHTKSNLKLTWGHNEGHNLWHSLYGVKIIKKKSAVYDTEKYATKPFVVLIQ